MPKAKQVADKAALADAGAATQDGKSQEQSNGAARKGALAPGSGTATRAASAHEDTKKRAHSAREAAPAHLAREAAPAAPAPKGRAPGHAGAVQRARPAAHGAGEAKAGTQGNGDAKAKAHEAGDARAKAHEAGDAKAGTHGAVSTRRQLGKSSGAKKASPEGGGSHGAAQVPAQPPAEAAEDRQDTAPELAPDLFLEHQVELLRAERDNYLHQAEELRAQAEALALEHEPGDVQFDEEGGEGGTANVDRELDLHLSAQAQAAIEEIDAALAKIAAGTYGRCESCGSEIPRARLEALPHARLCVSCKSGGLTARRQ